MVQKIIRYGQGILGLQKQDVILSSFPKSGNTWVRFFFCNVISICEWDGKTVDFATLNKTMPEFGIDNLFKPWCHDVLIPRIVKTHKNFLPIFKDNKVIFLLRDPRDVMVSRYKHLTERPKPRFAGSFPEFIRDRKFGLESWCQHYRSWVGRETVLITYESLRKNDISGFSHVLECLNISIDVETVKLAAQKSRFENIRSLEDKYGNPLPGKFKENYRFTRQGKSGNWKEFWSDRDLSYFAELKSEYNIDIY